MTTTDGSAGATPAPGGAPPPTLPVEDVVGQVAAAVQGWLTGVAGRAPGRPVGVLVEADESSLQVVLTGDGGDLRPGGSPREPANLWGLAHDAGSGRTAGHQDEGGLRMRWSGPLT